MDYSIDDSQTRSVFVGAESADEANLLRDYAARHNHQFTEEYPQGITIPLENLMDDPYSVDSGLLDQKVEELLETIDWRK